MASSLQACIHAALLSRALSPSFAPRQGRSPHLCPLELQVPASTHVVICAQSNHSAGAKSTGNRAAPGGKFQRSAAARKAKEGETPSTRGQPQPPKPAADSAPHEYHHDVSLTVPAPLKQVWELWTDLESAPKWMPWITAVELSSDEGAPARPEAAQLRGGAALHARPLSKWICSTSGFQIAWTARVTNVTEELQAVAPHCALEWATTEGLQSSGRVTFMPAQPGDDGRDSTSIELKIVHTLPPALARVMDGSALGGLIRATLRSDLERFQQYVIKSASGAATASRHSQPAQQDHG
ncbi:hypothetical protein KFL_006040080 [Klebsormidium nitens]|uniref:Coenzyme Q-binding protein COQ10 START domain-containing protein n=1 Tax=Klebsormidium nitens TaxID=105231 RepID=A0A1Y1IN00_KLENI|nr:hypothetical protein KFL_006040080 [Klebsormidium nitens]|eukprot:GAQ90136.1 hypothetical protein KFL_006040080 [Klebsormidium nitens]